MGDKRFGDENGEGVQHWLRGPDCTVEVNMSEEYKERVTMLR